LLNSTINQTNLRVNVIFPRRAIPTDPNSKSASGEFCTSVFSLPNGGRRCPWYDSDVAATCLTRDQRSHGEGQDENKNELGKDHGYTHRSTKEPGLLGATREMVKTGQNHRIRAGCLSSMELRFSRLEVVLNDVLRQNRITG